MLHRYLFYRPGDQTAPRAEKINQYDVKGEVIRFYGYRIRHEGYSFKVWIIELPCAEKDLSVKLKGILRNLRINLLRIHAGKETVRILLNSINDETITLQPGSAKTELADNYLKEIAEKLFSKKDTSLSRKACLILHSKARTWPCRTAFLHWRTASTVSAINTPAKTLNKLLKQMSADKPKVILFLTSSPTGKNPLDFGKELRKIQKAFDSSVDRNNYDIRIRPGIFENELMRLLSMIRSQIISYNHACVQN